MTVHSDTSNDHQPLFSFITSLSTLTLLYFPTSSFSVILVLTSLLLLLLLRLGSNHKQEETDQNPSRTGITSSSGQVVDEWAYGAENGDDPDRGSGSSFVGWEVGAPLEVIHEEGDDRHGSGLDLFFGSGRYPSLSSYYPETDSDSSSEEGGISPTGSWGSPEKAFSKWEAEDREESLIEIALNGRGRMDPDPDPGLEFRFEEENWIEIDPLNKSSSGFE